MEQVQKISESEQPEISASIQGLTLLNWFSKNSSIKFELDMKEDIYLLKKGLIEHLKRHWRSISLEEHFSLIK